jgi:rod shape-determining protein MreC
MSDPTFRIGVRIAGSQSVGVLQGEGSSHYNLQLLDSTGTINHHDAILSLGSDNGRPFVPGIPVGYVSSVDHKNASLTQTATVTGYSNLNALGVVSVILQEPSGDPKDSLVPKPTPTATIYVTSTAKPDTVTANATSSGTAKPSPIPSTTTKKATK